MQTYANPQSQPLKDLPVRFLRLIICPTPLCIESNTYKPQLKRIMTLSSPRLSSLPAFSPNVRINLFSYCNTTSYHVS